MSHRSLPGDRKETLADAGLAVAGIVLLGIGVLGFIGGIFFFPLFCVGPILAIIGFVLLLYGALKEEPHPVYVNLPASPYGPAPTYCPQCGSPLQWVPQYGRGFCPRCGAYR